MKLCNGLVTVKNVLEPIAEQLTDELAAQQYAVVDDFLPPDDVMQLRQRIAGLEAQQQLKPAAVGSASEQQIAEAIRRDRIWWLDEGNTHPADVLFFSKLQPLVAYLNRVCFAGIRSSEFHYAQYSVGAFYRRHVDTFNPVGVLHGRQRMGGERRLSVVCYLNDAGWQAADGGQLVLYTATEDGGAEQRVEVLPLTGRMVVFDSRAVPHEVLPAQRVRYSVTGWLKTQS